MHKFWRRWSKALGEESENPDTEDNIVIVIRTIIVLTFAVVNLFIIADVLRHW